MSEEFTFPMPRTCPFAPPPEYARMRELGPVVRAKLPNGVPVWAVTRQAAARQLLRDPRISSATGHPERPRGPDDDRPDDGFFIDLDPPEHTRYRQPLIPELGLRAVAELRPAIESIVDSAIDDLLAAGPSTDLVRAFARPVPVRVMCALYGVPEKDWDFVETRMRMLTVLRQDPRAPEASRDLRGYLRDRIDSGDPAGLIGRLSTQDLKPEALVNMCFLMLLAGYESPANMISLGVVTLLEHPHQLAALRADPGLLPGVVDELLRYQSIQDWVSIDRSATADVEVDGVHIRAGDRLVVLTASVNRDARAFERPDDFDPLRPTHHLAFGHGVHQCVGQNLARAELEVAYSRLFARIPTLRLAVPVAEVPWAYDAAFFGPHALPVTWEP